MKVLTVKETAEVLKVKPQWVYRMIRDDGLPCIRLGRQVRIDEDALKEWLAAHSS
jgi:excisionase family DNA binding protein